MRPGLNHGDDLRGERWDLAFGVAVVASSVPPLAPPASETGIGQRRSTASR
jgi:hypothetical protein